MGKVALLPGDMNSRANYLNNRKLPDNYMGDFSLMGFIVDRYHEALNLLLKNNFRLEEQNGGADIHIDNARDLQQIKTLLKVNNFSCDFSDIADSLYQA